MIGILLIPSLAASALEMFRKPADALLRQHLAVEARSAGRRFAQAGFTLACLPYEAFFGLDAVVRTAGRILFTRKRLLEWQPSGNPDRNRGEGLTAFFRSMWIAPAIAAAATIHLGITRPVALGVGRTRPGPVVRLPRHRLVDQPPARPPQSGAYGGPDPLSQEAFAQNLGVLRNLRRPGRSLAATGQLSGIPQSRSVAHRTSPTNMGLSLLANLAAYDFGYLPSGQLVERTENALRTMESLARHRGHFFNWYDTQSLEPLFPLYVSTVDSGNLSGHLLETLRQGLLELPDHAVLGKRWLEGVGDTSRSSWTPWVGLCLPRSRDSRRFLRPRPAPVRTRSRRRGSASSG